MGQGVESALHCCLNLSWVGAPVPGARLAGFYDLPPAYLNKQLQALVRAGIRESVPGPRGGFRSARESAEVSLLVATDVVRHSPATPQRVRAALAP